MQTKTREEVAALYGVSRKTFYKWLSKSEINLPERTLITPKQLEKIYDTFGVPETAEESGQKYPIVPKNTHFRKY